MLLQDNRNQLCIYGKKHVIDGHSRCQSKASKHKTFVKYLYNVGPNVDDVGPALYKCYTNVLCLLGKFIFQNRKCMMPISLRHFFAKSRGDDNVWLLIMYDWSLKRRIFPMNTVEAKGFFHFEIITTVSVSCFRFILIPMLWVYGHYEYVYLHSAGIDIRRQNLTSVDVRFWRLKSIPALYGLMLGQHHKRCLVSAGGWLPGWIT